MELILIIGAVVVFFYFKAKFKQGYEQGKVESAAKLAKEGYKPWGKSWGQEYGSAYFMTPEQIHDAGIGYLGQSFGDRLHNYKVDFLMLGATFFKEQMSANTFEQPGHLLTLAPTRSGKGVGLVVPNLLTYEGTVIVNDIKGENHAITARRRRVMKQEVLKFAPFDDDSHCWNPFDEIDNGEDAWEDARTLAELLIASNSNGDEFWQNEARNLLSGVILYVHTSKPKDERNIATVRHLLTQGKEETEELLAEMGMSKETLVQRASDAFSRADDKVKANIFSTLNEQMSIWDSPRLQKIMGSSDINFKAAKEKPTSIFFCIPPDRLSSYSTVVRLFMGLALNSMTKNQTKPDIPVLFMLDEFPALGRVKAVEEGIAFLAGYGVRLWLFAQDLKQLAHAYGEKTQSIVANCAVKQFFGVADYETAKLASHMCGDTTIPTISYSSDNGVLLENGGASFAGGSRPLLSPDEIMSREPHLQLIFYQGQKPVSGRRLNYLEEQMFVNENGPIFDPNPFH